MLANELENHPVSYQINSTLSGEAPELSPFRDYLQMRVHQIQQSPKNLRQRTNFHLSRYILETHGKDD